MAACDRAESADAAVTHRSHIVIVSAKAARNEAAGGCCSVIPPRFGRAPETPDEPRSRQPLDDSQCFEFSCQ